MARYLIRQDLIPLLTKSISPIARKAVKNGFSFTFDIFDDNDNIVYKKCEYGEFGLIPYIPVELDMNIKFNGWDVIMSITESDSGVNKISYLYEPISKECYEKYLSQKLHCEHCNCNRRRKYAFLLKNVNNGDLKLVGSSCLMEFTDGLDASLTASCFEAKQFILDMEKRSSQDSHIDNSIIMFDKNYVLSLGIYFSKKYGYKKNCSEEISTADRVRSELTERMNGETFEDKISSEDIDEANVCFSETKTFLENKENKSLYEINLLQILRSDKIALGDVGLLVSSILYYTNNVKKQDDYVDEFFGEIGAKYDIDIDVKSVKTVYIDTRFGTMYINTFKDIEGHSFVWKTSKSLKRKVFVHLVNGGDLEDVNIVCSRIKGTVSEQDVYNGKKQTELKRCKVLSEVMLTSDGNVLLADDVSYYN